jgi:hypothetical protein
MARRAFFRADKFRAGNGGRRHDGAVRFEAATGKKDYGERSAAADDPPKFFALPDEPASKPRESHGLESGKRRAGLSPHFYW